MMRPAPPRWLLILSLAVLTAGSMLHILAGYSGGDTGSEHALGSDDAYITFRYAQNLLAGHGPVYNPGERVEGYSNFLWVMISAVALSAVDPESIYLPISLLNVLLLLLLATLFYHRVATLGTGTASERRRRADLAVLLLACCPTLWLWTASGLETLLVVTLQIVLWIAVDRPGGTGGTAPRGEGWTVGPAVAVLYLLFLTRADGFVWLPVTVAFHLIHGRRSSALKITAAVVPGLVAWFAWRFAYYGELLPNTYFAKVGEPLAIRLRHGGEQLWEVALGIGLLPYLLALLWAAGKSLASTERFRPAHVRPAFPLVFGSALVAYWLWIGGDHFGERFLLVLFPLGIATVLDLTSGLARRGRLALLAGLLVLQLRPLLDDPRFDYHPDRYDCWVTLGRFLGEWRDTRLAAGAGEPLLAIDAAGKVPYFSGLRTLDMLGLNDHHIARVEPIDGYVSAGHNKRDPGYVLSRRPDLIATWVQPSLDLAIGLERELYEAAGYRLVWMLNSSKVSRPADLVDVRDRSDRDKLLLLSLGYTYGVLARPPTP